MQINELIYDTLNKYFGYDSFRKGQKEVITSILQGRDVLAVMPTGSGKSVCYQVPALCMSGITLVVSPLISLMQDQVAALSSIGVRAAYFNSTLSYAQIKRALSNAALGMYKIIYVAPERLLTPSFAAFAANTDISLVAIDESHCVSQWGHDFRRSYLDIKTFVAGLKNRPVVAAFTATATEQVKRDITNMLGLDSPFCVTTGYDRPNLFFGISQPADKMGYLLNFLKRRSDSSGIIYCATRKNTDLVYEELNARGIKAVRYHAGLDDQSRKAAQEDFIYDRVRIIVATNAFGMGIDKSNVSFVIHYNMPMSIEAYYQEAGRAGRDGSKAECVLLYSPGDYKLAEFLIRRQDSSEDISEEETKKLIEINLYKLAKMRELCAETCCVREKILSYFGENSGKECGNCSYCRKADTKLTLDSARKLIGILVYKTGGRFGGAMISDILAGRKSEKIAARGFDKLYEFGSMRLADKSAVKKLIDTMVDEGFLEKSIGEYPTISVTQKFLDENKKHIVTDRAETVFAVPDSPSFDAKLLDELKAWRKKISTRLGVPPYIVFTDVTLNMLATYKPKSTFDLSKIKGIGEYKVNRYGEELVSIIKKHAAKK